MNRMLSALLVVILCIMGAILFYLPVDLDLGEELFSEPFSFADAHPAAPPRFAAL